MHRSTNIIALFSIVSTTNPSVVLQPSCHGHPPSLHSFRRITVPLKHGITSSEQHISVAYRSSPHTTPLKAPTLLRTIIFHPPCNWFHFAGDSFPRHCCPLSLSLRSSLSLHTATGKKSLSSSLDPYLALFFFGGAIIFFSKNLSSCSLANIFACLSLGLSPLFNSCCFPFLTVTIIRSWPKSILSPSACQYSTTSYINPPPVLPNTPLLLRYHSLIIGTMEHRAACRLDFYHQWAMAVPILSLSGCFNEFEHLNAHFLFHLRVFSTGLNTRMPWAMCLFSHKPHFCLH